MIRLLFLILGLAGCGENSDKEAGPINKVGFSALAIQNPNYPKEFIKVFDGIPERYLAILWESFGDNNLMLKEVLELEGVTHLNIYLGNGSCRRNGNCSSLDDGDPSSVAIRRLKQAETFLGSFDWEGTTTFTITLEDNLSPFEANEICKELKKNRAYAIYRNPVRSELLGNSPCFDGYELHEDALRKKMAPFDRWSNDGIDMSAEQILARVKEGSYEQIFYAWDRQGSNCLNSTPATDVFPHKRDCKFNTDLYSGINSVLREVYE